MNNFFGTARRIIFRGDNSQIHSTNLG